MKKREWRQAERPWLLAVEDPQQLGRDIGSGTYNMRNVQHLFAAAAATLRDCHPHPPQTQDQQWASIQVTPWTIAAVGDQNVTVAVCFNSRVV